tara:strand:+ start:1082 stop:1987 length:906 start_codon:yes stop_codon:yes gene_type:complete
MNITFGKQIGFINYFYRGIIIKIFKNYFKNSFLYNTSTNNKYYIYKWDLSGHEVFMTQCFTDWGNEYLFIDSIKKRKKGLFLDVGCHTGFFSVLFNDYFKNTIGFEPSKKCLGALENIKKKFNNFEYHNYFVGRDECIVDSYDYSSGYAFGVNEKNMHQKIISRNEIKKITIDNFCINNNIKKITGIKIDVDGVDFDVLKGAENIIKKDRPSVMIELYSKELIDFFSNHNYEMFSFSSTKQKPYNLKLEKLDKFINNKWLKMVCCIPKEYSNDYKEEFFKGNYFFGINKKKILNYFNFYLL